MSIKKILKKIVPQQVFSLYHISLAKTSSLAYGKPSQKMIIVGITGTKGKTSTANFIWSALNTAGMKTGLITTANIRIGDREVLNTYHMTMPGRSTIQKLMADMVKDGCVCCIVETTSEGLKQWRHIGVEYDIAVFTNLTPEHLPSHENNFEKYKEMKGKMFQVLDTTFRKNIGGEVIPKIIIANADSEHASFYLQYKADKKITYGLHSGDIRATNIMSDDKGVTFTVDTYGDPADHEYKLNMLGEFNVYNALPALIIGNLVKLPQAALKQGILNLSLIPGRMEKIVLGQSFTLIVDYAHEKQSMTALLSTAKKIKKTPEAKVIVSLGAEGGGRDKRKRPEMGQVAGTLADYVIVCNVDPYEDDPKEIIEDIARAAEVAGKIRNTNLFTIEDRRAGIAKCLELAGPGDIVLITGKGAEQSMIIDGKTISWDDRTVVKEELQKILNK